MKVNKIQKDSIGEKRSKEYFGDDLKGKKIAMWGLAFKPNTDDIREAPSLYIIEELLALGCDIVAFDPEAIENMKEIFGNKITYATEQYEVLDGADALAIVTEWSMFRAPDFSKMAKLLKSKVIFDGRNLYNTDQLKDQGFYYNSIGRKIVASLTRV